MTTEEYKQAIKTAIDAVEDLTTPELRDFAFKLVLNLELLELNAPIP